MIEGKWFPQGSDLSGVLAVREAVFGRGGDDLDAQAWNVLVWQDGIPAATGRIWWQEGSFRLGDLGVLPEYRGQKLGDLTLRLLLFKVQSHYAREVRLRCAPDTAGFFSRLGFRPDPAAEDPGEMLLPGDEIDLDTCKNCPKASCPNRHD